MDSTKVALASIGNYGLSLTNISLTLQCIVAFLTIIYLLIKINNIRK